LWRKRRKRRRKWEEDSEELWNLVLAYAKHIEEGRASQIEFPKPILNEVAKLPDSAGVLSSQQQRLDMIRWMYISVADKEEVRKLFAQVVREYFWDEFITTETKKELLSSKPNDVTLRAVAADSYWEYEGVTYIRYMDKESYEVVYLTVTSRGVMPTSQAVVSILGREKKDDPLLKRPIDIRYTGMTYGFISKNLKGNKFLF
jgi:hypothetical protein